MSIKNKDTNYDRIFKYLATGGGIELTEVQQTFLARWTTAHEFLLKRHSDQEVANMLHMRFPEISLATAYRDLNKAKKLFGEGNPMNVRYRLKLLWDWIMEDLKLARAKNDTKSIPMFYKQLIEVVKQSKEYDSEIEGLLDEKIIEITALPEDVGLAPVIKDEVDKIISDYYARRKGLNQPGAAD